MRLHQIRIDYHQEQDRLLLRISTDDSSELRFWLTRRFVKGLWPVLMKMAEAVGEARVQHDPTIRKAAPDKPKPASRSVAAPRCN